METWCTTPINAYFSLNVSLLAAWASNKSYPWATDLSSGFECTTYESGCRSVINLTQSRANPTKFTYAASSTNNGSVVFPLSTSQWEMGPKYLNFSRSYQVSVDVAMSIRSIKNGTLFARPFYKTWLYYWPTGLGKLILIMEPTLTGIYDLVSCLQLLPCTPVEFVVAPMSYMSDSAFSKAGHVLRDGPHHWSRWFSFMMQLWKFEADTSSTADIIAFTDDDSCMYDFILPSEIVNSRGELVARGVQFPNPDHMRDKR
jgi:hypothetical protein